MRVPRIAESSDGTGLSHRPSEAGISRLNAFPRFHPGLFSASPYGRNGAECLTTPLLRIPGSFGFFGCDGCGVQPGNASVGADDERQGESIPVAVVEGLPGFAVRFSVLDLVG
jgi:hypothetical protein